jgi:NADPH-dependent 2,4-dienoyl-CoA reductase/sulfur reductase-like enzyme
VIAGIAPHDSVERFEGLGVTVIADWARFTRPTRGRVAGDAAIEARRFVIATGSSPLVPPIPGLDGVRHYTNEDIFDLRERPRTSSSSAAGRSASRWPGAPAARLRRDGDRGRTSSGSTSRPAA